MGGSCINFISFLLSLVTSSLSFSITVFFWPVYSSCLSSALVSISLFGFFFFKSWQICQNVIVFFVFRSHFLLATTFFLFFTACSFSPAIIHYFPFRQCLHTHTHTHARTHARVHTHTHAHNNTCTRTQTYTHKVIHTHSHIHTLTVIHTHTHRQTLSDLCVCVCRGDVCLSILCFVWVVLVGLCCTCV